MAIKLLQRLVNVTFPVFSSKSVIIKVISMEEKNFFTNIHLEYYLEAVLIKKDKSSWNCQKTNLEYSNKGNLDPTKFEDFRWWCKTKNFISALERNSLSIYSDNEFLTNIFKIIEDKEGNRCLILRVKDIVSNV